MPWDPVRDLLTMQERLESLFGRANPGWVPAVDLAEMDDVYRLTIELPGLSRSDITLEYTEPVLALRGARPPVDGSPERYHQLERAQGQFSRSFKFSVPVAADAITAEFVDGVLTVTIPKAAASGRRIDVS